MALPIASTKKKSQKKVRSSSVGNISEKSPLKKLETTKKTFVAELWQKALFWISQKYGNFKRLIKRKREERLTVMFIPHNERSIRDFHISNLTLTVVLGVLGFLLVISSILVILHNSTVQEVDNMKISQREAQFQFAKIREEIRQLGDTFAELREIISTLYGYAKGKEEVSLFAAGGALEELEKSNSTEGSDIPLEVFLLERITHDLGISAEKLQDVKEFLKKREKIIRNTPTLWPVKGYLLNPFGYVRHAAKLSVANNRGVDIVSHPGAKVHATAPGIVVAITRDSRFLYTVRIRHNYGYETLYQGLDRVSVRPEEKIAKGEVIGYLGVFPDTLEAMLHYEIHIGIEPVDPLPYLSFLGG